MITEWRCDICKSVRPDCCISVSKNPLVLNGEVLGDQNVKYCNDRQECIDKSKDYSFIN